MDKMLNQVQSWKALLPEPWLIGAAARDFAREATGFYSQGRERSLPPGGPVPVGLRDLLKREADQYEAAMSDAYMTGVMEFAKALTSGEFQREPWTDDPERGAYREWFNALPEASVFTPAPAGAPEVDLSRAAEPRDQTQHYMDLYRKQPCEAYGRALFGSLLKWPAAESWQHFGQVYAIYQETMKYSSQRSWAYIAYMGVMRRLRSKYAGTWNDYHIARWFLGTKDESQRRAAMVELHWRIHLEAPKWAPVSTSAAWAVRSLRDQHPEFDADFRAAVTCEFCLDKLKSPDLSGAAPDSTAASVPR